MVFPQRPWAFYVVTISGVCIGLTHSVHLHIASSASIIELNLWHGQRQTQQYPCYNTKGRGWGINFVFGWLLLDRCCWCDLFLTFITGLCSLGSAIYMIVYCLLVSCAVCQSRGCGTVARVSSLLIPVESRLVIPCDQRGFFPLFRRASL